MEENNSLVKLSDEALLSRVVQRDADAFAVLYDRYAPLAFTVAIHMIGHSEAEEAVQEVFTRVWNRAHQFDASRGSFRGWFVGIVRHYALDQLKQRRQEQRALIAEGIDHLLVNAADPRLELSEALWQQERQRIILEALRSLPHEQRQVIVLAYFGGLSQSTIARRLGWPLGTVKKRARLGLQKLRAALLVPRNLLEPQAGPAQADKSEFSDEM